MRFVFSRYLEKFEIEHGDTSTGLQNASDVKYFHLVGLCKHTYVLKNV